MLEKGVTGYFLSNDFTAYNFLLHWTSLCITWVQEWHDLTVSQLVKVPVDCSIYTADVYYEYTEPA